MRTAEFTAATRPSNRRSLKVYEVLQRDIMLGNIAPLATILEMEVAERFGCSQGTAREALIALNHDGLVDRVAHRGTFVADSRVDDARELIQIRRDIECRSVPRVLQRYTTRLLEEVKDLVAKMVRSAHDGDAYELSLLDREFHLRLFDAADLPNIQPILRRCLIHNHRFKILNSKNFNGLLETAERHEIIVDALSGGDADSLAAVLSHHITTIVEFGPNVLNGETQRYSLGHVGESRSGT